MESELKKSIKNESNLFSKVKRSADLMIFCFQTIQIRLIRKKAEVNADNIDNNEKLRVHAPRKNLQKQHKCNLINEMFKCNPAISSILPPTVKHISSYI